MNIKMMLMLLAMTVSFVATAEAATPANSAPAVAATPVKMPDNHGKRMDKVAQELSLNEEQKTKMHAIMVEKHQKMKAIHDETNAKLKAVLTPEQYTKFETMHPNKRHGKPQ